MVNSKLVGKFIIVKDLLFSYFMKDKDGNINVYDSEDEACAVCGMYEFENALVLEVKYNYVEPE